MKEEGIPRLRPAPDSALSQPGGEAIGADENRISGLLMETGVTYNKQRLHKVGYFADLMANNAEIHDCVRPLLRLSREHIDRAQKLDYALVSSLERDPLLKELAIVPRLRTSPSGSATAKAIVSAWTSKPKNRNFSLMTGSSACGSGLSSQTNSA